MSDDASRAVRAGDLVAGRFRVVGDLGEGSSGIVHRAAQLSLGRDVALKVLRPRFAMDPVARARFTREARVASTLRHPNAVEIHDFGDDGAIAFIAMELLTGATLRATLEARSRAGADAPLELTRVLAIGYQMADVLAAAHAVALVHRDLKPENVFLEPTVSGERERVVVVDFGLAFIADHDELGRHTVEGVVAGTPAYLSPEQARGERVGPPSDVYALGCVLFELLAGAPPFEGDTARLLSRHLFVPPPRLRERRSGPPVPVALDALLQRMLRKRAEERPTAAEVRATLGSVDPSAAEPHARGRESLPLVGREARMLSPTPRGVPDESPSSRAPDDDAEVAMVGPVDVEVQLALAANGMICFAVSDDHPVSGATAVLALGATAATVRALTAHGAPVVTDAERSDMERVAALLRAGADEVVLRPLEIEDVVSKVSRALGKARRRARRG